MKIYGGILSPPSKAVYSLANHLGIKYENIVTSLDNGDNQTEEFLKMNPAHAIPIMTIGDDYHLAESFSIMRYLIGSVAEDHPLYPADPKKRALIDMYIAQMNLVKLDINDTFIRDIMGEPLPAMVKETCDKNVAEALEDFEENIVGYKYCNGEFLSILEFHMIQQLDDCQFLGWDLESDYPNTWEYFENILDEVKALQDIHDKYWEAFAKQAGSKRGGYKQRVQRVKVEKVVQEVAKAVEEEVKKQEPGASSLELFAHEFKIEMHCDGCKNAVSKRFDKNPTTVLKYEIFVKEHKVIVYGDKQLEKQVPDILQDWSEANSRTIEHVKATPVTDHDLVKALINAAQGKSHTSVASSVVDNSVTGAHIQNKLNEMPRVSEGMAKKRADNQNSGTCRGCTMF